MLNLPHQYLAPIFGADGDVVLAGKNDVVV